MARDFLPPEHADSWGEFHARLEYEMERQRGGLAPLWSAVVGEDLDPGGTAASADEHHVGMLEALHAPATLRRMTAYAAWLRAFAPSFTKISTTAECKLSVLYMGAVQPST